MGPKCRAPSTKAFEGPSLFWTTADPASGNEAQAQVAAASLPLPFSPLKQLTGPDGGGAGGIESSAEGFFYSTAAGIAEIDGSGKAVEVIPTGGFVQTIEEDGVNVYFVDPATKDLMLAPEEADGGMPRALTTGVDPGAALQADGTCVYWIDTAAQAVMMVGS